MPLDAVEHAADATDGALRGLTRALLDDPGAVRAALERRLDELARGGIDLPYAGDRLPLTPAVLPASWVTRLEAGCRAMFAGIEAVFAGAFGGDRERLADYLLFSPEERRLLHVAGAGDDWAVLARPDFMAARSGPALLESNVTSSLGLLESGLLGDVLLDIPAVREFVAREGLTTIDPARALVDTVVAALPGGGSFVVLADWRAEMSIWAHLYRHLARLLRQRGVAAEPVAIEDLDVGASGVYADGRRVDLVYRFYTTTRLTRPEFAAVHEPVLGAIEDGRVRVFGGYAHKLFTPKLFLALLSDERFSDRLPSATSAALHRVLPWTRLLEDRTTLYRGERVGLLDFARTHRAELVLKPNLGYGGRGVTVGSDVAQSEWETALSAALMSDEHWLVQEKVATAPAELAFLVDGDVELRSAKVDYGAFMFGRSFAGAARRNSTQATGPMLTNLSRGGGLSPVFFRH